MTKSKDFSPGAILFQLAYGSGDCAESSYIKPLFFLSKGFAANNSYSM